MRSSLFAIGIGVRAMLLGAIAFAVLQLVATGRFYATALIVAGIGVLVFADLMRCVLSGDRLLERFVEALAAGDFERPSPAGLGGGLKRMRGALERAATALSVSRTARQRQLDYLQTLVDNVSVALLVVHSDGQLILANRAARELGGPVPRSLSQLPAVGEVAAAKLLSLRPGERAVLRLANGQRVLGSGARFAAGGESYQLLSLQNIHSELDAAELRAWQDLVRILAHEMMNSLTPISSLAESLRPMMQRESGASPDVTTAIDAIARRSAGLMSFVDRYRRMADLPAPQLQPVKLSDLIRRIETIMRPTFVERGIAYTGSVEPDTLLLQADVDLLEQALINVIRNAVEAVDGVTAPQIEVTARQEGEWLSIRVEDSGRGLDPRQLERIFVPFFTTKPGGSGIGLSLARQIALAHGGRLEVAANAPQGAVFTLQLPVRS